MLKWSHLFIIGMVFFFTLQGCDKKELPIQQDREEVIMRQIGHEVMLLSGDSSSIVKPVIQDGNKYRIQFEAEFSFLPDDLVKTIDSIVKTTMPYESYFVQVEACVTKEVIYSYEISELFPSSEEVACKGREQSEACYEIVIQFIKEEQTSHAYLYVLLLLAVLSVGGYVFIKSKQSNNEGKIKIGAYLYSPKKMTLTLVGSTTELTSKESELLNLLYSSANETVARDTLLNKVWGDEGDYVGRTLDVYISKLRKKLENDASIEIKNIRGIGYKLIV